MKFADYIGMLVESVEELTFEKLKKELKAGKKFHWSNKGYSIVLDKNGDVHIVWDLGGKKENSEGLDAKKFKEYVGKIFEDGKKLTEEKKEEYVFQISGYFDGDTFKKIQYKDVKSDVLDSILVGQKFKKEYPKAVVFGVMYAGKDLNEAKEEVPDYSKANISKIVSALKKPLPLLSSRDKLNEVEKEKFDDFIMLALNYFINGRLPRDCTEQDKEILEKLGFKVSGKSLSDGVTFFTKISK